MCQLLLAGWMMTLAPASLPKPDPTADLKAMQGEWAFAEELVGGRLVATNEGWRVVIDGMKLRYIFNGRTTAEYALTLDATKGPKRFAFDGGSDAGSCKGIYRLEKGTLTICYDLSSDGYPKSFDERNHHTHIEVFRRKRP